jgi:hypothetical protein
VRTIGPQPGPQTQFCSCPADIAIYGGSAGGGKTFCLLLDATRGIYDPLWNPVLFRRTYKQITAPQGLWDKACELYPLLGGRMRQASMDCVFPSGARISFSHMEHEQSKIQWQGTELPFIGWDELTHFSAGQFWYLVSRMRSLGKIEPYMRGTCNPQPGSWVAELLEWWIDPIAGTPIPERAGALRWFCRMPDDSIAWADKPDELPPVSTKPMSFTFVPATLADNPALLAKDPYYADRLRSLPRAERESLLGGNWLSQTGGVFDRDWFKTYSVLPDGALQWIHGGDVVNAPSSALRRFATIDTAGTSKDRAEKAAGKQPSWSVCCIWDYYRPRHTLLLRNVLRIQAEWSELEDRFPNFIAANEVPLVVIENAHFGPVMAKSIKGRKVILVGPKIPGMAENHRGAKLERAVASGCINRIEDGLLRIPDYQPHHADYAWLKAWLSEHLAWQGLPDEVADQIDNTSYACYYSKQMQATPWGGIIQQSHGRTR